MTSIAWAAGLYEGEGHLTRDKRKTATYMLRLSMTDKDIIERFASVWNTGTVTPINTPHAKSKSHWKQQWLFRVCNKYQIRRILEAMLPYLGLRRAYDAQNCLDAIDGV